MSNQLPGMVNNYTVDLFDLDIDWICGCAQWREGKRFHFVACKETCLFYQDMLAAAKQLDCKITYEHGH